MYQDFEILVNKSNNIRASSSQGNGSGQLHLDMNEINLTLKLIESKKTNSELLKLLGNKLYQALFPNEINARFHATIASAQANKQSVRLRLIFTSPELAVLPWEFLYDKRSNTFLGNNTETVLSRYIDVPLPKNDIKTASSTLKVLLVISTPNNLATLDATGEENLIREALGKHIEAGQIELDVLTEATTRNIRQKLREKSYNVFHFIGHGDFQNEKGYIYLVDENGQEKSLDDETFANFFLGDRHLGLIVLNCCRGGMVSANQIFAGTVLNLVQKGIPAVVAMQYKILDSTAKLFADEFYSTLALGCPLDAAIQKTRNAISQDVGLDKRDFATPTLYMRAKDGIIFDVDEKKNQTPGDTNPIKVIQGKQDTRNSSQVLDTVDMPTNVSNFFGRAEELDKLEKIILGNKCRLISLVGMTGIGKTTLAVKLKERVQHNFRYIIWKNLRYIDSFHVLIDDLVKTFSLHSQDQYNSENINNRIKYLIDYFQRNKCLLVLDDVSEIMYNNEGWEEFGKFIQQIIQSSHQSCFIFTSHRHLKELNNHRNESSHYQTISINGLKTEDVKDAYNAEIHCEAIRLEEYYWQQFVGYYGGNPVALYIASQIIIDRYNGEISSFVERYIDYGERHSPRQGYTYQDELYNFILQDLPKGIHNLLGSQFDSLKLSEKKIMYVLAIRNEPIHCNEISICSNLEYITLINKESSSFSLLPIVRDYVINRLIHTIIDEIVNQQLKYFNQCSLLQAHAKDYIKDIQKDRIIKPIINGLLREFGGRRPVKERLTKILAEWGEQEPVDGCLAGNILNLLLLLGTDLTSENFSNIPVRNADLQNAELHDVDFSNSKFDESTFSETLSCIHSITFSPDGRYFAAGDANGNVRLWETENYKLTLLTDGESRSHQIWSVAFSPDGKILASAGEDKTIRLWDVTSLRKIKELKDEQCIYSIKFSFDGDILVSAGDKQITLWNLEDWDTDTNIQAKPIAFKQQEVYSVAFGNNRTLASGSQDGYVRLWNISEINHCQLLNEWQEHEKAVRCVVFSPDDALIASGSEDGTIRLWKTNINQSFKILKSDQVKQVWTITFSSNGKTLASGSSDKNLSGIDEHHNIRLWSIDTGECLKILGTYKNGHKNQLRSVAFCPNPRNLLISGADDHAIKVWDINNGKCQKTIQGYTNRIWSVAFSPNAKMLVTGSEDNKIRLWNIQEGISNKEPLATLSKHTDWVWSVVFNPDGNMLASASEDNTIRLWRLQNSQWQEYRNLNEQHVDRVRIVAFSPDGKKLASGGNDRKVILWDIENHEVIDSLYGSHGHTNRVLSLAFSPNKPLIASSSRDRTIRLWNYAANTVNVLTGHDNQVHSLAFSPNGNYLISGGFDNQLKLWDIKSQKIITNFNDNDKQMDRILTVAFHPEGLIFASSGHDKIISLWNLDNNQKPFHYLKGHEAAVESLMFSPKGGILVSSSQDQTIKTWNIFTGRCLDTIEPSSKPYQGMKINGIKGLTDAQKSTLIALGAIIN